MTTSTRPGRAVAAAATLLALLATAACGGSSEGATPEAKSSTSTAPSTDASDATASTESKAADPLSTEWTSVDPAIKQSALDRWGEAGSRRAAEAAVAFVKKYAYNNEIVLLPAKPGKNHDLIDALHEVENSQFDRHAATFQTPRSFCIQMVWSRANFCRRSVSPFFERRRSACDLIVTVTHRGYFDACVTTTRSRVGLT